MFVDVVSNKGSDGVSIRMLGSRVEFPQNSINKTLPISQYTCRHVCCYRQVSVSCKQKLLVILI